MAAVTDSTTEVIMARGGPGDDGSVTFHEIFAGDPGFLPGEATLTLSPETDEAMGHPATVHVYSADGPGR